MEWSKKELLIAASTGVALGCMFPFLRKIVAPLVGTLVGQTILGWWGCVATSAGLAAIGGGSLASGGTGMAGGATTVANAIVVTIVGCVLGRKASRL
jgi:hypothetical protein